MLRMTALGNPTGAGYGPAAPKRQCAGRETGSTARRKDGFGARLEQTMHGNVPPLMTAHVTEGRWGEVLLAMTPVLRAFAWSLSHDRAEADDLVQETLVKAWSHRDSFAEGSNLRAWLFTILRNTFYSALARRRHETRDEDGQWAARQTIAANQDWAVSVDELRRSLHRLAPTHREALILVGGAGMTYQEAAEVCGCAVGTIKSRVNRARARLIKLMDDPAADDEETTDGDD
jgi:RNA polymerase sigma-70 factor, ECF subfamily